MLNKRQQLEAKVRKDSLAVANDIFDKLEQQQRQLKDLRMSPSTIKLGLTVSKQALSNMEDLALTPYTRNMMLKSDPKVTDLKPGDAETNMEKLISKKTLEILNKYCGKRRIDYNKSKDPGDFDHYCVDCGRNYKPGKDIRHVEPDMNVKRLANFKLFTKPIRDIGIRSLLNDLEFLAASEGFMMRIPEVKSSDSGQDVNLPFMNKHTNVGYPYFRNDKLIDPESGKTYGQLTSDIAQKKTPSEVVNYPFIAFGRNLRRKARPILGGSRIQALVYNQLEKQEILKYKDSCPFFFGYNDDIFLKEKLVKLARGLMSHKDYTVMNRDFAAFDTTVAPDLRRGIDAITGCKTIDSRGKDIAFWRGVSHYRSQLLNGLSFSVDRIYGRIFSGEIDTNAGGGKVNALVNIYSIRHFEPEGADAASLIIREGTSPLGVMGDDNLLVHKKSLNDSEYSSFIKEKFSMDVSSEKGEYGLFFLQRRLFLAKDNKTFVMITPFTRIIRSLANKEMRKGLGPAGGTLASYMLLSQLIEGPELLIDVARIFAPYDEYVLGTVGSVKQLTQLVAKEDQEALKDGKSPRVQKTASKLFDGDPLKSGGFNDRGEVNSSFVERIHTLLTRGLADLRK